MKSFPSKICHLTFTHSDYLDVFALYKQQMIKFFSVGLEHFIACNIDVLGCKTIVYDESLKYPQRLFNVLLELEEKFEYVFFDHEDMFLYDHPDINMLKSYFHFMVEQEADVIRLIKNDGAIVSQSNEIPSLYKIHNSSNWMFSIQPSFWKIKTIKILLEKFFRANIWQLEVKSQKYVKHSGMKCYYSHSQGNQRGIHHFDNEIYPYVATAIGKGKWNFSEYEKELKPLLTKNSIDPSERGFF